MYQGFYISTRVHVLEKEKKFPCSMIIYFQSTLSLVNDRSVNMKPIYISVLLQVFLSTFTPLTTLALYTCIKVV
jgi:hypothetical protein